MKRLFLPFTLVFIFLGSIQAFGINWLEANGTDTVLLSKRYDKSGGIIPLSTTTVTCPPLTLVITGTDPLCNGGATGTASVTVTGGTPPYTYLWTPTGSTTSSITGLTGNTYLVEVWDNVAVTPNYCSGSIAIVNPPSLIVNITPPSPVTSCFGLCDGSATASPSGGTTPYTYSWNTAPVQTTSLATGLCAQAYSVTVTDNNGCTKIKQANIGQPALLVANGSSTSITCFGSCNGTASTAPTGGNPPYTYSWAPGGATTSGIGPLCPNTYTCTVTDTKSCVATYVTTISQPPLLTVTVTGSNVLCNGACTGSVTATASGGMGNYTYSWAPGGCSTSACTGLCVGTYSLTLSDANGCTKTATVSITQPPPFTLSPTGTNISCSGTCDGTVNANPAGGTAPYTYTWAPGGCTTSSCTGLCAGTYTVDAIDAGGCTASGTVTLTQPSVLTITTSKTDVICPGMCNGTASASVAGGTTPYTYAWNGPSVSATTSAISNLCSGTYTIIVTDSKGCSDTNTVIVNMPSPLLPNISVTNNASCFGSCDGSVLSSPSGGTAPYTYGWSNGTTTASNTGLCAGSYTLTLTDANACPSSATVAVTQPAAFVASIAPPNPLNCNGDCNGTAVTSVSGGTPVYTYAWTTGDTTPSVTGLCAGVYSVTVTDANGCTSTASVTFFQPSTLSVTITSSNPTCSGICDGVISAIAGGGTPGYTFAWLPGNQTTSTITSQCAGTYTLTTTDSKGCTNTQVITLTAPSTLSANATILNNVLCAGSCNGSAFAAPSGGTAPFTYAWTGGQTTSTATGLCAGSFSVTVTDANGCSDIDVVSITQPAVLTSNISSTTSSCTLCNGTATVSTSGGTQPYTFLWSPTGQTTSAAVGLCVGNYTVDITDANGCTNSLTVTINPVVTLTITVSGNSVSCPGACDGIANATPFGGGTPYTYSWSTTPVQVTPTVTGLCAGTYSVTVGDVNGCLSTSTLTLTNPAPLTLTMNSASASCGVCNGTASVAPSGGTGAYTYTWSGFPVQTTATATGLCAGDYTVTVADANNCTLTNTVTVGNIPAIADNPSTTLSACGANDGAICVAPTGGTPAYTYLWAPGGATDACITGLAAGIYTVTISDAAGCAATFQNAVGNIGAPTITVNSQTDPTCFSNCDGSIAITASLGVPNYTYLWSPGNQTTTSVSALCGGTYIVQVIDAQPCTSFASVTLTDPVQFSVNPTITNVSCTGSNDGAICLAPSGGTSPYTYTWLPGMQTTSCLSALTAGSYSVVVADASGCDDTLLIPVSGAPALGVTIASTNVTCNGNNDGTATATVTGGTPLYTYSWSSGGMLSSVVGLAPNTYSLTVTDSQGCTATGTVAITEPALLTTTLSSTNITCNALCDGTAMLTASGGTLAYTYSWLPGGETTSSISGLCAGNAIGTVTDMNGCVSSKTATITQPAAITATVTSSNATCFGGCDGSASVSSGGGTGAHTYLWSPGGETTASVTGLCAGSYTITVTDTNGCGNTQLVNITAPAVLQSNITNLPPTCSGFCDGSATSSPVGGTGAYTYSWSTVPVQTTATATGLCSGTYTLTLFDANGCSIVQTTNVAAPTALTQANGIAGATCLLCNGSITIIALGGTSPYSFFWSTGETTATITGLCAGVYVDTVIDANGCISVDTIGVSNTTGPTTTVTGTNVTCYGACNGTATVATATGDGPPWVYSWFPFSQTTQSLTGLCPLQYFATVTDTLGCKTVTPINITEPAQLASNPVVTNVTCTGICNGAIATSATGGTGAYTYLWMPGGATTTSITNQCAGTYTLTLTDANNCLLTTTVTIGQNTILTSTITSTNDSCNSSCDGTASVIISGGTPAYSYLWMPTGLTTSAVTGLCAGTHTLTVTDSAGCVNTSNLVITEPAVLVPGIILTNPACNGACDGSLSTTPTGGTAPYTYLWMPGNLTSALITGLCAGNYSLTVTDMNNCQSTNTMTLTDPPALVATGTATSASCNNVCNGVINISPSGGTGAYTFLWSPGGQITEDIANLCPGIDSVLITDANGCTFTYSDTVMAVTSLTAIAGNDTMFCEGGTALLCSGSINAVTQVWYQLPAFTQVDTTLCVSVTPPAGVNDYLVLVTNALCSDSDIVTVFVNALPIADAGASVAIPNGGSTVLNGTGGGTYLWTPAAGLSNDTIANPTANPTVTTTYTLTVTDTSGCTGWDTVRITIIKTVIPNDGISPNGDGVNDIWEIPNLESFPDALVEVYNRWGELLMSTTDYMNNKWNGTYKGKDLPVGTYYYVINLNSDVFKDPITGPITILR